MKQIRLQQIGLYNAIPANELVDGDVMICNFGFTQTIKNPRISKTGKSIIYDIVSENGVYMPNIKTSLTRLFAVERVN